MYKHPEINYQPQHPMLRKQSTEYTIEEEGILSGLKSAASAVGSGLSKAAKAAKEAGANILGKSTAPKDKMTKANAQRWHSYYVRARALAAGQIAQKDEEKVKRQLKEKYAELKEATDGIISYDDSKKLSGYA